MAVMNATKTVVGVFDTMDDAQNAVRQLESAGVSRDNVSVIANKNVSGYENAAGTDTGVKPTEAGSVATDAGIGAALGGVGGLLLSFAGLAIPGVGPILAAGPIVAALSGAGIGAVAGGLIGALTESGIPEDEAHAYAEGVRRGHILVTAKVDDSVAARASQILDSHGALDVQDRASNWRERGWTGYNSGAEPLSSDEIRREREYYGAADRQGNDWTRDTTTAQTSGLGAGSSYPHEQAHDIGNSQPAGGVRSSASQVDSPSNFGDTVDNNLRRPDSAVVRAERGFERAMDSASNSAKRMASRIYDKTT